MKYSLISKLAVATLAVGAVGITQARNLDPNDYLKVRAGMSQQEVEQTLGKPTNVEGFARGDAKTTWSYNTSGSFAQTGDRVVDVDFGADGTVVSAGPRMLQTD